jgi:hypothetical protein
MDDMISEARSRVTADERPMGLDPMIEAMGQMLVEAANREANLRGQLIALRRQIEAAKAS